MTDNDRRERIRQELVEFANARHVALEPDDIHFVQGEPEIGDMPADQWLEAMTEERPEVTWL